MVDEIAEEAAEDELRLLRTEIYRWQHADPPVQHLTAFGRFRTRGSFLFSTLAHCFGPHLDQW